MVTAILDTNVCGLQELRNEVNTAQMGGGPGSETGCRSDVRMTGRLPTSRSVLGTVTNFSAVPNSL